jgi:hypothetical protein
LIFFWINISLPAKFPLFWELSGRDSLPRQRHTDR